MTWRTDMREFMIAASIVVASLLVFLTPSICLSAQAIDRDGRFIAYDNGTVLDTKTGLIWAARDNGKDITWQAAKTYCENYRGGGYTDWRMPSPTELYPLDIGKNNPDGYPVTRLVKLTGSCMWSSKTRGSTAAYWAIPVGATWYEEQSGSKEMRVLPVRTPR